MAIGYPTNIVIMLVAGMAVTAFGAWLTLSQTLRKFSPQVARAWRWGVGIVLAVWFIGRLALSIYPPDGAVLGAQITIPFLVGGILLGLVPLTLSPTFRQIVRSMPETWLVGIQAIRMLGVLWLALLDMKLLPPEFALPAGIGDFTVGALALVMVYVLATRKPYARVLVIAWNLLGLLDFVSAVGTGVLFIRPYATQLVANGVGVLYLNYVFIVPTFVIPIFVALHFYSLYQMLTARASKPSLEPKSPVQATASTGR